MYIHEESRAHIHVRDIQRTRFQSRLETQKFEAVVCPAKPFSTAIRMRNSILLNVRFVLVGIPFSMLCSNKGTQRLQKCKTQPCFPPFEPCEKLNPPTFTPKTAIMGAAIIRTVQTNHTIWKDDCQKFQAACLFLSTVIVLLKILVCAEITQSLRLANIHEIAIDDSYQVQPKSVSASAKNWKYHDPQ